MKKKTNIKKTIKLLIQILFTAIAITIVVNKLDLSQIKNTLSSTNFFYLFLAFLMFNISKIISSIRLNRFFDDISLKLSQSYNLKLYYLGMFYNLFLPGGIGGDGYKIYILKKYFNQKILTMTKVMLLDRISGLIALLFLTGVLGLFSSFTNYTYISYLTIAGVILIYPITILLYKYKFSEFLKSFQITNFQALLVQLFQVFCAYFIVLSFGGSTDIFDLLVIFLISSIVAVLPLTVGGIGARELTFIYLLQFLGKEPTIGVALSVIFFLITALSSFIGVSFINYKWSEKQ
ncbi:lysylphosphatidylglycerol synthase transmembrane domain-containing protein [Arcobacter arenosus]|uniref:lysylphosphatidylglycerol synthase transmembrane domain-containing protein n=1 Tax=Arcobacter arenosus TaxID=2576037 RepID=UPI003BAB6EBD